MSQSANLNFEYLVEAQTQKHITVNDALAKLDATCQLVVKAPQSKATSPKDGEIYLGADSKQLALYLNGGFTNIDPKIGWAAFFAQDNVAKRFTAEGWQDDAPKANMQKEFLIDFANYQAPVIPAKCVVFGVTARVVAALTGDAGLTSWQMGVAEDVKLYGNGLWLGKNGWARSLTYSPRTFWNDTKLEVKGEGGAIKAGKIKIYLYALEMGLPPEV